MAGPHRGATIDTLHGAGGAIPGHLGSEGGTQSDTARHERPRHLAALRHELPRCRPTDSESPMVPQRQPPHLPLSTTRVVPGFEGRFVPTTRRRSLAPSVGLPWPSLPTTEGRANDISTIPDSQKRDSDSAPSLDTGLLAPSSDFSATKMAHDSPSRSLSENNVRLEARPSL